MRFMLKFRFPNERGNALAKNGTLAQTVQSILEDPAVAEPLFIGLDATIEVHAMMTPEDLQRANSAIEQAAQKYG
jgi:hypothetical protein